MKRIQFELTEERVEDLDQLIEKTGLKTRVNFFNEALTLYEWAINEREAGRVIASIDEERDRYKEIEMPGFLAVSYKPPSGATSNAIINIMAALIAPLIAIVESVEKEEFKLSENSHILSNTTDEKFLILANQFAEDRINPQVASLLTNQELEILDLTFGGSNLDDIAKKLSLPKSRIKIEILKMAEKLRSSYDRKKVKVHS